MAGRITKLTPELQAKIVKYAAKGIPRCKIAGLVGVHPGTLSEWCQRGREGKKPYAEFNEALKRAESRSIAVDLETIRKASKQTWQAAAWRLERLHPDLFSTDRRLIRELKELLKQLTAKGTGGQV